MAKDKFDFEKYESWCNEHKLSAGDSASLEAYKKGIADESKAEEKQKRLKEQRELFNAIAKYLGKNVKFNERCSEEIDKVLESMLLATAVMNAIEGANKDLDKIADEFGFGGGEDD